jgi:hypothetical protein
MSVISELFVYFVSLQSFSVVDHVMKKMIWQRGDTNLPNTAISTPLLQHRLKTEMQVIV